MNEKPMPKHNSDRLDWPRCTTAARIQAVLAGAIIVGSLLAAMRQPVSAATEVQGRPDEMQIQIENATVGEALNALSGKFKLSYKLPPTVTGTVTGVYTGTLRQVLGRLLDGHDYIVTVVDDGGIELVVLGASNAVAIVPATSNNNGNNAVRITPAAAPPPAAQPVAAAAPGVPPLNSFLSSN